MKELNFPLRSCFLALPLQNEAKENFQRLQKNLEKFDDVHRFQNPASPHLTLQYWPSVMEIEYKPIIGQAKAIASRHKPFHFGVIGAGTFGSRGRDHVLFLTISFSPELALVKKQCPWAQAKPFEPHITLARVRHPEKFAVKKKAIMKALGVPQFRVDVDRLRLYAEIDGIKQTPLEDFLFQS